MEVSLSTPPTEQVESADGQAVSAGPTASLIPQFIAFHTLAMRVDTLGDLPDGTVWIRTNTGVFQATTTDKIPSDRLLSLIQAGRIYALWAEQMDRHQEMPPDWRAVMPKAKLDGPERH